MALVPYRRAQFAALATGAASAFLQHTTPQQRRSYAERIGRSARDFFMSRQRRFTPGEYQQRSAAADRGRAQRQTLLNRWRNNARSFRPAPPGGLSLPARYGGRTNRMLRRKRFKRRHQKRYGSRAGRKTFLSKLYHVLCTPMTYKTTTSQAVAGTQGLRAWAQVELGGLGQITTLGNKKPSNFLFNSSGSGTTLNDYGGTNYKLAIDKWVHNFRIQNRSNAHMELKIYECMVRKDVSSGVLSTTTGYQTIFSESVPDPSGGYFPGIAESNWAPGQSNVPTGVSAHWQHPAFTPFMSNKWVSFFKILKVHSRVLQANEILPMKFSLRKKAIKGTYINANQALEWQKGWTKVLLFSWVGQPIDDNTLLASTKAKCDLFLQDDLTIKYHFIPGTEPLVNVSYSAPAGMATSTYKFDPATANMKVPAEAVIQTVTGTDEVDPHAP